MQKHRGNEPFVTLSYLFNFTIYTYNVNLVCLCVRLFRSQQKFKRHEHLGLGVFWANLRYDEAGLWLIFNLNGF